MSETTVVLKKGEGRSLKAGGPWIYDNEIESITGTFKNGDIAVIKDFDGYVLGKGFINQNSKIRVRKSTIFSKKTHFPRKKAARARAAARPSAAALSF